MKKETEEPKNKKSTFTAIVLVLILINSFIGLIVMSSGSSSDTAPALEELEEQIADLSRQLSGLNLRLQIIQMQQNASQFKILDMIKNMFGKVIEWVK